MKTILLLLVLGLLIAWLIYRQGLDRPSTRPDRRIATRRNQSDYHAVSIKPGAYACSEANEIAGERYLADEAPEIPLPGCTSSHCECHFVHHNDRRSGKDRRSPFTSGGLAAATGTFANERRKGNERRAPSADEDYR